MTAVEFRESSSCPRVGILPRATVTCGLPCKPCVAAPNIVRSVRCGVLTARSRGSATSDVVIEEIVQLRRLGFRFIALADDNFYPVTLTDIQLAEKQGNAQRVAELQAMRSERFELMEKLAKLPSDMVFFTQITMEAGEDTAVSRRDAQGPHQGRAGRSGIRHRGRAEVRL